MPFKFNSTLKTASRPHDAGFVSATVKALHSCLLFGLCAAIAFTLMGLPKFAQANENGTEIKELKAEVVDLSLPSIGDELEIIVPPKSIEEELNSTSKKDTAALPSDNPDLDALLSERSIARDLDVRRSHRLFQSFVASRRVILKTLYKLMSPVTRDKTQLIGKLKDVDQSVQGSAEIISRKTRTGFFFTISLSAGLGLTKKIIEKIKSERFARIAQRMPQFYYLAGTGLAVLKITDSERRQKISLVLISDFDRLEKVHSFVAEVSLGLNYGFGVEVDSLSKDKITSHSVGILGTTKQSENHFSHNFTAGLALPPALPAWMVYSSNTQRRYINLLQIPWFDKRESLIRCEAALY